MTSPYVAPNISSLADMKSNIFSSSPLSSNSGNNNNNNNNPPDNKSFLGYTKEKYWNIITIVIVIITIGNVIVYVLRQYTSFIDNTYTDKASVWLPWLKK